MDIDEMEAEESEIIERKVVDECLRRMAILGIDKTTRAVCSTFYQSMLPLRFGWEAFLEEANAGKGPRVQPWMKPVFQVVVPVIIVFMYIYGMTHFAWK